MKRPCFWGQAVKGTPRDKSDESQCGMCWNAINDPEYQKLWGLDENGEKSGDPPKVNKVGIAALPRRSCC